MKRAACIALVFFCISFAGCFKPPPLPKQPWEMKPGQVDDPKRGWFTINIVEPIEEFFKKVLIVAAVAVGSLVLVVGLVVFLEYGLPAIEKAKADHEAERQAQLQKIQKEQQEKMNAELARIRSEQERIEAEQKRTKREAWQEQTSIGYEAWQEQARIEREERQEKMRLQIEASRERERQEAAARQAKEIAGQQQRAAAKDAAAIEQILKDEWDKISSQIEV